MQASLPPMHQFAKPARNKLHASHRDRSSSTAQSEQHQSSHHREASVHNLGLFARLSSFSTHGNHSGGSRRIEASSPGVSGHTRRPSRDGLDWYCRGSKYSPKDEMLETPIEHPRTPSLTHSRASSSDSGSGASVSSSFQYKPLPSLPEPKFDSYPHTATEKLRPASIAILEQIDELSSGTFARKNSIETPAHIFLPHLDLAAREDTSPAHSPLSSSNPTPRAGSVTIRPSSSSQSPQLGWTPRGSAFSMSSDVGDDSLSGPFALEASLARLDVLSEDEDEEYSSSQRMLAPLQLDDPIPSTSQPHHKPSGAFFHDRPDFGSYRWDTSENRSSRHLDVQQSRSTTPSPRASPGLSDYVVPEDPAPAPVPTTETPNTLAGRLSIKIPSFSRNGWRGWRSASQAATPSTRTSGDYPSIFVADHADTLAEALQSEINTAVQQKMLEALTSSGSPKLKLSPQFTFGRGTPSPRPDCESQGSPSALRSNSVELPEPTLDAVQPQESTSRRGHGTNRAASEDHIAVPDLKQWSWQGSASTSTVPERLSHRSRLNLRKTATNRGPRDFTQSFDTNELQRLRESAGGKLKYDWI